MHPVTKIKFVSDKFKYTYEASLNLVPKPN